MKILTEIISLAGIQLIPYALCQLFEHLYIVEYDYKIQRSEKFSSKKFKRYNKLRFIFFLLGLVPALILHPTQSLMLRHLYRRYMCHLSDTFYTALDRNLSSEEKIKKLWSAGIEINASSDPLDLPPNWYQHTEP